VDKIDSDTVIAAAAIAATMAESGKSEENPRKAGKMRKKTGKRRTLPVKSPRRRSDLPENAPALPLAAANDRIGSSP
jgi:hypothetical protein